ncbi:MAG TPA: transporter substrate-binding domain-containing protein [Burkholderiales bacterium]|nr:transporter substrate-binding domain-containing protein [Burkholderiales bacterium]
MLNATAIARTACLLTGLLLASQPALALKLLTEENPPLNYTENKKLTGMATEVVQEMGRRANMKLDFEVMAWEKAYEKAQADKETCLYSTARLSNRENAFKWVGPIAVNKWGLYALSGFKPAIKSLKDVRPYRVGGVERDAKTEFLKQQGVTNITEERDDKLNPAKLTLNRKEAQKIDLWITSVASARKVAAQAKVPGVKLVYVVREAESYLACSPRTAAATLKSLAGALDGMKKDGSYQKIMKAYESQ